MSAFLSKPNIITGCLVGFLLIAGFSRRRCKWRLEALHFHRSFKCGEGAVRGSCRRRLEVVLAELFPFAGILWFWLQELMSKYMWGEVWPCWRTNLERSETFVSKAELQRCSPHSSWLIYCSENKIKKTLFNLEISLLLHQLFFQNNLKNRNKFQLKYIW